MNRTAATIARPHRWLLLLATDETADTPAADPPDPALWAGLPAPAQTVIWATGQGRRREDWAQLMASHPGADVLLLRAALAVAPSPSPALALRLAVSAHRQAHTAAACSLTCAHPVFDPLPEGLDRQRWTADAIDRAVFVCGEHELVDAPTVHSHACWLRADRFDPADGPDTAAHRQGWLDAWARRARARGWTLIATDAAHVDGPALPTEDLDPVERRAAEVHAVHGHLRRALTDIDPDVAAGWPRAGLDGRPVILHVEHGWGGGLSKWVREFAAADRQHTHLLLSSQRIGHHGGQRIHLHADAASRQGVRVWDIAQPIRSLVNTQGEYRRLLDEICEQFAVDAVVISSFIGHTCDLLRLPGIPVFWVVHDFFPVCEAIFPRWDGIDCPDCAPDRHARCRLENPANRVFGDHAAADWITLRESWLQALLDARATLVAPSADTLQRLGRLAPPLQALPAHVVPHGLLAPPPRGLGAPLQPGERARLLIVGANRPEKGSTLLPALAERLRGQAEVVVLGCDEAAQTAVQARGWTVLPRYGPADLAEQASRLRPHLGLLLSAGMVETFSYVLSELQAMDIPPLAVRVGALAERIRDGENGFLCEPTAAAVAGAVQALAAAPEQQRAVLARLAARPVRTAADMARDWSAILPAGPTAPHFMPRRSRRTALTDAYRQIDAALLQYRDAYLQIQQALAETRSRHDAMQHDLTALRAACHDYLQGHDALDIRHHPWRIGQALNLHTRFRDGYYARHTGDDTPPDPQTRDSAAAD